MSDVKPQRKSCLRALWRAFVFLFVLVLVNAVILGVVAWNKRIEWATKIARQELDKRELSDVTLEIEELLPNRVVLNIRVGSAENLLFNVRQLEVRFSFPDILHGEIDKIHVCNGNVRIDLDGKQVTIPLMEQLKAITSEKDSVSAEPLNFRIREIVVENMRVHFMNKGVHLISLCVETASVAQQKMRDYYNVSIEIDDRAGCYPWFPLDTVLRINGEFDLTGFMCLYGNVQVDGMASLFDLAREIVPEEMAQFPVAVSNTSATVRMELDANAWTNINNFKVTAELGRGSVVTVPAQDAEVTLQSARLEASGNLTNAQCRVSAGIAGLRVGGDVQVSQEEGRLLSVRGTAHFGESGTNRTLRASMDTDLSGRAAAKILPDILPLMPRLLTDGGTFHAEAALAQEPEKPWQGEARFLAEARRTSVTLPSGRFAAGRAAVGGRIGIDGEKLGDLKAEVIIEDGMYSSQGNSARANFRMELDAPPPYKHAIGTLEGKVNANTWLAKNGVKLADTNGIVFSGAVQLTGIKSNPAWVVALHLPPFGVMSTSDDWHSTVNGRAGIVYSLQESEFPTSTWQSRSDVRPGMPRLRDVSDCFVTATLQAEQTQWVSPELPGVGCATVKVEHASVKIDVPPFSTTNMPNVAAHVRAGVAGGSCTAGDIFSVEGLRMDIPLMTWSPAEGVAFPEPLGLAWEWTPQDGLVPMPKSPKLTWERMTLDGLGIEPTGFALTNAGGRVEVRTGIRCEGSALNIEALAQVPLDNPGQLTAGIEIPDMVLEPEDSLAAWIRKMDAATHVTGSLAVRADVRMLGSQPYVAGRLDMTNGSLTRGELSVSGIRVSVPFEVAMEPRTVQRPFVAFEAMKMGDIRLTDGRVDFQVSPREFFIDRMEAGFCKGKLFAYSVHLDPQHPSADVTVYVDRIDVGEMLMMTTPVKGKMEGLLYGRFPVGFDNGKVRLSTGYLYSLPGQGGKLKLDDSRPVRELLDYSGIRGDVQEPLSKALSDMDFNMLRLDLEPRQDGDAMLKIRLTGKSNDKDWPAPVDLNVNVLAPLEELLNMGNSFVK